MASAPQPPPAAPDGWRWFALLPVAVALVWGMVVAMLWMIRAPAFDAAAATEAQAVAQIVKAPDEPPPDDPASARLPDLAPPPPPDSPPSMARAMLPAIPTSSIPISVPEVKVAAIGIGTADLGIGAGLGQSGTFGGFAGGGNGSGNGGGGGTGSGAFKGRELVPLSTARPQMPDWACKKKLRGWVEVVFVVTPAGKVENVRIVDAEPRGVYEGAAIESVGNWIYPRGKVAAEVKQRVEMDPADCAYNYR